MVDSTSAQNAILASVQSRAGSANVQADELSYLAQALKEIGATGTPSSAQIDAAKNAVLSKIESEAKKAGVTPEQLNYLGNAFRQLGVHTTLGEFRVIAQQTLTQIGTLSTTAVRDLTQLAVDATQTINSARDTAISRVEAVRLETETWNTNMVAVQTATKTSETNAKASENAAKASQTASKTSETNSKASETAAKTSETNSATSAAASETARAAAVTARTGAETARSGATTQATNAGNSATSAATSATNSANSATTASSKAADASGSAAAALASETNAKASEDAAAASQVAAKASEDAAKASQTAAASSASTANTHRASAATASTNAGNSATAAAGSATTAGTKAGEASASATAAAGSASAAKTDADRSVAAANRSEAADLSGKFSGNSLLLPPGGSIIAQPSIGTTSNAGVHVRDLAGYRSGASSTTGAIVFKAPNTQTGIMSHFEIKGHRWSNPNAVLIEATAYRTSNAAFRDVMKVSLGSHDMMVRFAVDPDGKMALILGDVNTQQGYQNVFIDALFSQQAFSTLREYAKNWTTELVTDLSGYTFMTDPIPNTLPDVVESRVSTAITNVLSTLRGGVASGFDTLKKLYDRIEAHVANTNNPHGVTTEQIDAMYRGILQANVDLNTVLTAGGWRLNASHLNLPHASAAHGNMLVMRYRDIDTVAQIVVSHNTREAWYRGGVRHSNGAWVFQPWSKIATTDDVAVAQASSYSLVPTNLTTENLNDIVAPGNYHQPSNANATLARNYPIARAGYLEVKTRGVATSEYHYQTYTDYNGQGVWHREKYVTNAWGSWRKVATTDDVTAGDALKVSKTGDTMTGRLDSTAETPFRFKNRTSNDYWQFYSTAGRFNLWWGAEAGNGTAGDKFSVDYSTGAVWTAQLGDLNDRIESRARAYADGRIAKTGDTMTGQLTIADANARYTRGAQQRFIHLDGTWFGFLSNVGGWTFRVNDAGQVWTAQLGDLHDRIESRAAAYAADQGNDARAHANARVNEIRSVSEGYLGFPVHQEYSLSDATDYFYTAPDGAVVTGFRRSPRATRMDQMRISYIQSHRPDRGWATMWRQ